MSLEAKSHFVSRANRANLTYVNRIEDGYRRRPWGRGFTYQTCDGDTIKDPQIKTRITDLAIPPAWTDVYISQQAHGHLQAVGTDAAGRRQYIYHPRWQELSQATKFDRMQTFGEHLPKLRRRVRRDLNQPTLTSSRVLAAVVRLLDRACVRVGNRQSAAEQDTFGATTLKPRHVDVDDTHVSLDFRAKGGKQRFCRFADAKVAKVIEECEDILGQFLFHYVDESEHNYEVTSGHINEYLQDIVGPDTTAKDFRTWKGCVSAWEIIETIHPGDTKQTRKRVIQQAITGAAEQLNNTRAVCRRSYIHPAIIRVAETGDIVAIKKKLQTESQRGLSQMETRFLNFLSHQAPVAT